MRGNHEIAEVTMQYGFYEECLRKYAGSTIIWQHCTKVFDFFSLSAVIGDRVFSVHGGLSPNIFKIDVINSIKKDKVVANSPASDLVWSDPSEKNGWNTNPSYLYGPDIVKDFLHANNVDYICRAHQLCMNGYFWNSDHTVITFGQPKLLLLVWECHCCK